jgi:hypothetical protein
MHTAMSGSLWCEIQTEVKICVVDFRDTIWHRAVWYMGANILEEYIDSKM